jgi:type IV pilus assembly protein PilQ
VTDFATPVQVVNAFQQGDNVRMIIEPSGQWEHNAYQTDTQFVVEVKPLVIDTSRGARGRYVGEKLSLNFQNVEVRAVLNVIADFTDLNVVTSDSVGGSITLRLKDVPWDQALEIILQTRGLDQRRTGNVIWIAPRDELATREKLALESQAQITELEQTRTESFQLNYTKAIDVQKMLADRTQPVLSKRGSAVVDARTNTIFVQDVPSRLEEVRKLIAKIDIAVRQVMIEARIVEASDTFAKNLGVKLGYTDLNLLRAVPKNTASASAAAITRSASAATTQASASPAGRHRIKARDTSRTACSPTCRPRASTASPPDRSRSRCSRRA